MHYFPLFSINHYVNILINIVIIIKTLTNLVQVPLGWPNQLLSSCRCASAIASCHGGGKNVPRFCVSCCSYGA